MDNKEKELEQNCLANDLMQVTADLKQKNGEVMDKMINIFIEGLKKSRMKSTILKPGDIAPNFSLKNATGETVTLSNELKLGPVILTWYRGKWCPYCNVALNYMQLYLSKFKEAGASLLALTPEQPDKSLSIKERHELKFEVLTDEDNLVAQNYGGVNDLSDHLKGSYFDRESVDHYQQNAYIYPIPATYIIDQNFTVRYAFVDADYRLRADPEDILQVLKDL